MLEICTGDIHNGMMNFDQKNSNISYANVPISDLCPLYPWQSASRSLTKSYVEMLTRCIYI